MDTVEKELEQLKKDIGWLWEQLDGCGLIDVPNNYPPARRFPEALDRFPQLHRIRETVGKGD